MSDTNEAFDKNNDELSDITPTGKDNDFDGIDDAFEVIDTLAEIDSSRRIQSWKETCSPRSLTGKLLATRSRIIALYNRVGSFAAKSRSCGGTALTAETARAKTNYDLAMERLALEFGGDLYRCSRNTCSTSNTTRAKTTLKALVNALAGSAKRAKQQAIKSCNTPAHPPGFRESRMNTEDYLREAQNALSALPSSITRCP